VSSAMDAVAGCLAFPAPSAVLTVTGRTLEVFPGPPLSTGLSRRECCAFTSAEGSLVAFHLSFRALAALPELLAASEEASSSSSRGIRSRIAPLSLDLLCVHSRKPELPSARPCQGLDPVPPSWSLTTSTAFSAQGLRVCCTPLTTLGFDAFPALAPRSSPEGLPGEAIAFPAPRIVPFEEFPSSAAVPHHCGRCPLAFAARSSHLDCPAEAELPPPWPEPRREPVPSEAEAWADTLRLRGPKPLPTRVLPRAGAPGRVLLDLRRGPRAVQTVRQPKLPLGPRGVRSSSAVTGVAGMASAVHRSGGGVEEPVRCPGEAPIRRGGPPRHQTGLGACRRTGRSCSRAAPGHHPKVGSGAPRERPCSACGASSRPTEAGPLTPQHHTRASGASGAARCQAPPSTPLAWSS